MGQPLLQVDDLKVHFKTDEGLIKAVDGVSFELEEGETLGIVGESGSGKSVSVNALMGLVPMPPGRIAGGRAQFAGRSLLDMPKSQLRKLRGNDISMIFQDPMSSLNPFLKISKQLTEVLALHKNLSGQAADSVAIEMLEAVGIPDAAGRFHQYPHQFSGGMRQRVMIAMALLCEPKLLIADEPTTALDVTIQAQILELIASLREKHGTSVILITHDLGVVAGMAEEILVMYAGRVAEYAPVEDLFGRPAHPYTKGLLESVPRIDETEHERLQSIEGLPPIVKDLPPGCPFRPRCDYADDECGVYPERTKFSEHHYAHCHHPISAPAESGKSA